MDIVKSAAYFIVVLSVLVVAHEWGHFVVAKLCGMRVDDFSLFFGPRIWRVGKRNGTEYNVRCIPFGGFVKIAGMDPDEVNNGTTTLRGSDGRSTFLLGLDAERLHAVDADQVSERIRDAVEHAIGEDGRLLPDGKAELQVLAVSTGITEDEDRYLQLVLDGANYLPDPNGFSQKPIWQRASVIGAGPFMSVLFGYILFCLMGVTCGLPYALRLDTTIAAVVDKQPATMAGIRPGDRVVQINQTKIADGTALVDAIHNSIGKSLHVTVQRNGALWEFDVVPISHADPRGGKPIGIIGIMPKEEPLWKRYPPMGAVKRGSTLLAQQFAGIGMLFTRPKELKDSVGGILQIAGKIHQDSKDGPRQVIFTAAILSLSLGIMNLLPIPILDGGHLVMLTMEAIRRRRMSSRELYTFQMVGISIIGVLFVLVMYNDIVHLFFNHGPR